MATLHKHLAEIRELQAEEFGEVSGGLGWTSETYQSLCWVTIIGDINVNIQIPDDETSYSGIDW